MINKKYVRDFNAWLKEMQLKVSLLENEISFMKRDIELSKKQLMLSKSRIKYFKAITQSAKKEHAAYMKQNR